jgi:hypothetical protein
MFLITKLRTFLNSPPKDGGGMERDGNDLIFYKLVYLTPRWKFWDWTHDTYYNVSKPDVYKLRGNAYVLEEKHEQDFTYKKL